MSADLSQFYQAFFDETAEHLAAMEKLLLALDVNHPAMDDLNAIFRAAHSIKGGAATFGFDDMTEVTHVLETLLDKLRKQEMSVTAEMVNVFLEAGDVIGMQLAAHSGESATAADVGAVAAVCKKLEQLSVAADTLKKKVNLNTVSSATVSDSGFFDGQPGAPVPPPVAAKEIRPPAPPPIMKIPGGRATHEIHGQGFGFFDDEPVSPPKSSPPVIAAAEKASAAPLSRKEMPQSGSNTALAGQSKKSDTDFGFFDDSADTSASGLQNSNTASGESDAESAEQKAKRDFHGKGFGFF